MTSFLSPWGYLVGFLACALVGWALSYLPSSAHQEPGKHKTLDGLRGILATSVVFHHIVYFRTYFETGIWNSDIGFYGLLGYVPVNLFFILTGFLFWDKALNSGGEIPLVPFFRGRIRRIVPLYSLFAMGTAIATLVETGFRFNVPIQSLGKELVAAFSMGIHQMPSINGSKAGYMAGSISWTLVYEWRFYLVFPILAAILKYGKSGLWLLIAPVIVFEFDTRYLLFLLGIAAAHLNRIAELRAWLAKPVGLLIPVLSVASIFLSEQRGNAIPVFLLCFAAFLPIACGNSILGLLTHRSFVHLGRISYSVYLLHCLILFVMYESAGLKAQFMSLDPVAFWVCMTLVSTGIMLICTATFRYIEAPFMSTSNNTKREPSAGTPID